MKIKKQGDNFQKTQGRKKSKKVMEFGESFFCKKIAEIISPKHEAHSLWGKAKLDFLKSFSKLFIFFLFFYFYFEKLCENQVLLFP